MGNYFKAIPSYEGLYSVNTEGAVYSHISKKFLKTAEIKGGYLQVQLFKNGKGTHYLVHRLVGFALVDGYFEGAVINHIDYNPKNNHYTNLEWVTQKENRNHSNENINKMIEKSRAKYYKIIYPNGEEKVIYNLNKFCKDNDLNQSSMSSVVSGRHKTHQGYKCIKLSK